jgi:hypothetical protein
LPAYVAAFFAPGYGSRTARRYRAGSWTPQVLPAPTCWREGELEFVARCASSQERLGPLSVDVVIENGLGERVALALKWMTDSCITLVRGCLTVSAPWPREIHDFEGIARLLLTSTRHDRDGHALGHLDAAAEFDVYSATLLEVCDEAFLARHVDACG